MKLLSNMFLLLLVLGYTENSQAIQKESILMDESKLNLNEKIADSVYVMEVISNGEKTKTVVIYCYYEEADKKIYYMVIRTAEGLHVASIKDFNCSPETSTPLSERFYTFTPKDLGSFSYLALGSRSSTEDDWERYDICLNCDTIEIRKNTDSTESETIEFRWSKPGKIINSCPSLKQQQPMYNLGEPIPATTLIKDVYVSYYEPYLVLNCHYDSVITDSQKYSVLETAPIKYHSVLRSNMGLFITSTSDDNCQMMSNLFQLGYVLLTMEDGSVKLIEVDPHTPPERGDYSCWFYGCKTCPKLKETRIFIFRDVPEEAKVWKKTVYKEEHCPMSLGKSDGVKRMEVYEAKKEYHLVAKYKNEEGYQLDCYHEIHWRTIIHTLVIKDSNGEHVATLDNLDCSTIEKLQNRFDVFVPSAYDNDDDVNLVVVGIGSETSNLHCSYIICRNCEKEKTWNYYTSSNNFQSHWTVVPTESCYALRRGDILIKETAIDNLDSKEHFRFLRSALNVADKEDDMVIDYCYSDKGTGTWLSQLKTLQGKHIVYIKGLDCFYEGQVSQRIISFEKRNENQYLVLVTRGTSENSERHPWCRYDVCLNCEEEEIKVNLNNDPQQFKVPNWSEKGLRVYNPEKKECAKKEVKEADKISTFANMKFPNYSIDCYRVKNPQKHCSILKSEEVQLGIITSNNCILDDISIDSFYLYTLYENEEYSLAKLGDEVNSNKDTRTVKENWFYYFTTEEKNWNPK